jgi:large subunit ribosomal protein L23
MAALHHHDTIIKPVITEKATLLSEHGKVVFQVPLSATKKQIAEAIEQLWDVKVEKVNTITTKGKVKRFRGIAGKRSDVKKAVVKLKDGHTIDVTTGLKR